MIWNIGFFFSTSWSWKIIYSRRCLDLKLVEYTKVPAILIGFVLIKPLEVETCSLDTQLRTDPDNLTVRLTFFLVSHMFSLDAFSLEDVFHALQEALSPAPSLEVGFHGISCWISCWISSR